MNTKAIRCNSREEVYSKGPGAFFIDHEKQTIAMWLPNDDVPKELMLEKGPRWKLSGTEDAPTLTPSINCVGIWHGYLTNGHFVDCNQTQENMPVETKVADRAPQISQAQRNTKPISVVP